MKAAETIRGIASWAAVLAAFQFLPAAAGVTIENDAFRLVLADAGFATSLVCKETGEECLAAGVRMPFCTPVSLIISYTDAMISLMVYSEMSYSLPSNSTCLMTGRPSAL